MSESAAGAPPSAHTLTGKGKWKAAKEAVLLTNMNQFKYHPKRRAKELSELPQYAQEYAIANKESELHDLYVHDNDDDNDDNDALPSHRSSPRSQKDTGREDYGALRKKMKEEGFDMHNAQNYNSSVMNQHAEKYKSPRMHAD